MHRLAPFGYFLEGGVLGKEAKAWISGILRGSFHRGQAYHGLPGSCKPCSERSARKTEKMDMGVE